MNQAIEDRDNSRKWSLSLNEDGLQSFFEFSLGNGEIRNRLSKGRVFVLAADAWIDLRKEMLKQFSTGATIILDRMGHAYGASVASNLVPGRATVDILTKLGSAAGWGKIKVTGDIHSGKVFLVSVKNCVFCGRGKDTDTCLFLPSIIRGITEKLYSRRYLVTCKKCIDIEDHTCEMTLVDEDSRRRRF